MEPQVQQTLAVVVVGVVMTLLLHLLVQQAALA
jgi:hypothetical protein